ncbi:type 4a pilus biogenesis protein PilO [Catenovulum sp. SM1970]|uniref:type 4a pilus biogenesis protein PilO n=1 Tax=Marinifaba aquimaris TaxID=2741323 RepID=UPI001574788F|nr:type 4a pilus biogenesis protein PilO [Marinifaba aquimaris]NTS78682.1 type 4a pilus biogenesis protein PilO [Marinifaba aquimaris]
MDWKNMDLKDIDINDIEIDLNDLGSLPTPVKIIFAILTALVVAWGSYKLLIEDKIKTYENITKQEMQLRQQFTAKYHVAVNADAYKEQLETMENDFAQLLKRLPTEHETPGLLDDVSFVGTTSGLTFTKINWESEIEREFYTELPLRLEVVGGYHEFGEFLSRVAALPRIVTLHDFTIAVKEGDVLTLNLLAKTYRYKGIAPNQQNQGAQ